MEKTFQKKLSQIHKRSDIILVQTYDSFPRNLLRNLLLLKRLFRRLKFQAKILNIRDKFKRKTQILGEN